MIDSIRNSFGCFILIFQALLPLAAFASLGKTTLDQSVYEFPLSHPGFKIILEKQLDPVSGEIVLNSKSTQIKSSEDLVRWEEDEKRALISKHGMLGGRLRTSFNSLRNTEVVRVRVYLATPQLIFLDNTKHSKSDIEAGEKFNLQIKPFTSIDSLLAKYSNSIRNVVKIDSGIFECELDKNLLSQLRFDKSIDNIDFFPEPSLAAYFSSLTSSAYNPGTSMPSAFKGQGINAATFESGIGNSTLNTPWGNLFQCLGNLQASRLELRTPTWPNWGHSQETFKSLYQTAPFANLYHHQSTDFTTTLSENFLLNNTIRSVSASVVHFIQYTCSNQKTPTIWPAYDANSPMMVRIDEWAYRAPYPVFCNPAGNWGANYEVHWQCYNAINVGNVRHTNLSHYEIDADVQNEICEPNGPCTQTRNPPKLWGGPDIRGPLSDINGVSVYSGFSGDREMPDLVTPGTTPTPGIAMVDDKPCLEGPLWCGTSYSAPITNGIAACIMSADSRMLNKPEVVKAVLLATAENVDAGEWSSAIDGKDGAGVVSGVSAVNFARTHVTVGPNGAPQVSAISTGNIGNSTPSSSTAIFKILIPNPKPTGKHLRIVLTWTSNSVRSPSWNYLSDLDLAWNGPVQRYSASYNGNVEIIDVPASELVAGSSHNAVLTFLTNRIPTSKFLKYAIAWTWVKDHAQ